MKTFYKIPGLTMLSLLTSMIVKHAMACLNPIECIARWTTTATLIKKELTGNGIGIHFNKELFKGHLISAGLQAIDLYYTIYK